MSGSRPCEPGCQCGRHSRMDLRTGPFGGGPAGRAEHGTQGGYVTHRKAGQEACESCKAAHRSWSAAQRSRARSGFTVTMDEAFAALGLTRA